ncbi:hypothetical protein BDU57DRAFT_226422 [Ampelomyces quisqualis]|uniref:Secreted protein n=1 Tax=Ampelomyces quisqualis TaxID=50730 RepID=A0A6A5QLM6_AMPQU|nr:hypothetical protein BDU57DRAFT_226422 [Ampelomyces quisqualis]
MLGAELSLLFLAFSGLASLKFNPSFELADISCSSSRPTASLTKRGFSLQVPSHRSMASKFMNRVLISFWGELATISLGRSVTQPGARNDGEAGLLRATKYSAVVCGSNVVII